MKYVALILAMFGILAISAAQISLPIKPPAYYGAPSTPKKAMLRRRDTGPHMRKSHAINVVSAENPKPAGAKSQDK
ncbi:uncharacterized protein ColSpa_02589 [Colletotrichum spaethianum]|uniref:Uncharacterized protein n=1 Tax=Colletotrichum spaethianum TaxID=700344 RepID=A0AA37L9X5_9PEZI|nr:uncharacterized protein ColSpa_02589 [Colletotrichum spaethianum]GKT42408.1 hypothetical protein ColSpa_02589 [Colletotrichum spaethianum]